MWTAKHGASCKPQHILILGARSSSLVSKFPDCRRKAYYLILIHDHLKQIPTPEIEDLGWAEAPELAKVACHEGRGFNSASWLQKAKDSSKEELRREVCKHLTREESEPYEMVYFKLYESQLPTVEGPYWGRHARWGRSVRGGTVWKSCVRMFWRGGRNSRRRKRS